MLLKLEPLGEEFLQSTRTSSDIEEAITCGAMEVMVVFGCDACEFVPSTLPWNRNRDDFARLLQTTHHAIDGPQAEGADFIRGHVVDLCY